MTSGTLGINDMVSASAGLKLLGKVISWDLPENTRVNHHDLEQALTVAGLDPKMARELRPRYAFARASHKLAKDRVIKRVAETETALMFQFNSAYKDLTSGYYNYDFETVLQLDKDTGVISCADPTKADLVHEAQTLLNQARVERTTTDVSNIIKRLFERSNVDLFPIRSSGGAYFVFEKEADFVNKVNAFVRQVNGNLVLFPVPVGTQEGNKSVREAVEYGLQQMIDEHLAVVNAFDLTTRDSTMDKTAEKLEATRFKIEAYAEYLEHAKGKLEASLAAAKDTLKAKILEVGAAKEKTRKEKA